MNKRNTIKYMHPVVGEIYIDKNTKGFEMYQDKEFDKLDKHIETEYRKCYGDLVPVKNR